MRPRSDEVGGGETGSAGVLGMGWYRVYERLGPVLGIAGFRALVERSLVEAGRRHDHLATVRLPDPPAPVLPHLIRACEAGDGTEGEEATLETLSVFLYNLECLLGEELSARLLKLERQEREGGR